MIFETQPEMFNVKSEEEKLQKLISAKVKQSTVNADSINSILAVEKE